MSKTTAPAAGGALPAEDLEHVADAIHQARTLMTDAAGLYAAAEEKLASARAALAIPAPADPVFAAIERHKVAWAAYIEAVYKLTVPEQDAYDETHDDADRKALEAVLATPPTTLAGLHAALAYVVEVDSDCEPDNAGRIAEALLKSPLFAGMGGRAAPMSEIMNALEAAQAETAEVSRRIRLAKMTKFEQLHRDYLAARAAYADPDGNDDDEVKNPLYDKQDAAELALLVQPSPATWGIWVKWDILDRLVATDAEDGHDPENRIITALGAIKADIIRFGLHNR